MTELWLFLEKILGENAHGLSDPYGRIQDKGKIDHYNIELQKPSVIPNRYLPAHSDWHIVPTDHGGVVIWDSKNEQKGKKK